MIKKLDNKREYRDLWKQHSLSFMQSWEWGEVKSPLWRPVRAAYDSVSFTIFLRKFPSLNHFFGYMPRAFSFKTLNEKVLKAIAEYAREELHLTHLVLELNITEPSIKSIFHKTGFECTGKTIQPNQTNVIDLTASEDDIFMRMRDSTRKKIRKAIKLGCSVQEFGPGDSSALPLFYPVMEAIMNRTEYIMRGEEYFQKIWDIFSETSCARILLITKSNRTIGGIFYLYDELGAYELYGGVAEKERGLMANYLLKWEGIKMARRLGKKFYDQWGVSPKQNGTMNPRDSLYKISLFKENFGGEYREFLPQQTIVFKRPLYAAYRAGAVLNRTALKIKKLLR